jgi:hypothetical protein
LLPFLPKDPSRVLPDRPKDADTRHGRNARSYRKPKETKTAGDRNRSPADCPM